MELFGLGVVTGFLGSLVFWEYFLLVIMFGSFGLSTVSNSPVGVIIGFGLFFFFPWGSGGKGDSLYSVFGAGSIFLWGAVYILLGIIAAGFIWNDKSKKTSLSAAIEYDELNSDAYERRRYTREEYIIKEVKESFTYGDFFNWITAWPFAIVMHFFRNTLVDIWNGFINSLYNLYASISNRNIKNAMDKSNKNK